MRVAAEQNWKTAFRNKLRSRYGPGALVAAMDWGLKDLLDCQEPLLLPYLLRTVQRVARQLDLDGIALADSAEFDLNEGMKGANRILEICEALGCTEYWNLPGGRILYSVQQFAHRGIKLRFLEDTRNLDAEIGPWSVLHAACLGRYEALARIVRGRHEQ
jgi:hypothetical protein